jgi:uncharacterized membrane protein
MYEDLGTILNKGFKNWTRNLNICIPFILNLGVSLLLSFFFFGLMGVMLLSSKIKSGLDLSTLPAEELYSLFAGAFLENLGAALAGLIAFFLLIMFIEAFFTAGAIGMAKRAAETGDTFFSEMLGFGSKNAIRLFLTIMLIDLMLIAGLVFVVPGVLAIGDLGTLLENPEASVRGLGLLGLGILIWVLYLLIITLLFSFAPYAVVIDELDPLEAISTSFRYFKENKLDVFLIWVISITLTLINNMVSEFFSSLSSLIVLLTTLLPLFVLQPLITVWWTRLYLNRKGTELYDPSKLLCEPDDILNQY